MTKRFPASASYSESPTENHKTLSLPQKTTLSASYSATDALAAKAALELLSYIAELVNRTRPCPFRPIGIQKRSICFL